MAGTHRDRGDRLRHRRQHSTDSAWPAVETTYALRSQVPRRRRLCPLTAAFGIRMMTEFARTVFARLAIASDALLVVTWIAVALAFANRLL